MLLQYHPIMEGGGDTPKDHFRSKGTRAEGLNDLKPQHHKRTFILYFVPLPFSNNARNYIFLCLPLQGGVGCSLFNEKYGGGLPGTDLVV